MIIVEISFWLFVFLFFYTFGGYPLTIFLYGFLNRQTVDKKRTNLSVSVVVAAYNEEEVIEKKIENILEAEYPTDQLEIVVVSDGSTDETNNIIRSYAYRENIRVIVLEKNGGKTMALNQAVEASSGDILVFSDADIMLEKDSIQHLVDNFNDPEVGCVCSQLNYIDSFEDTNTSKGGGLYWRYEEFIKENESKSGSTIGAAGATFAIKKELYEPLKEYMIDDFSTSMIILGKGKRVVFDQYAKVYGKYATTLKEDLRRRKRISNRIFTATIELKTVLCKLSIFNKFKFLFHKFVRNFVIPIFLILFVLNFTLAFFHNRQFYAIIFALQLIFYSAVLIGTLYKEKETMPKVLYLPYYFIIMNYMQIMGILASLTGSRQVTWTSPKSSRKIES